MVDRELILRGHHEVQGRRLRELVQAHLGVADPIRLDEGGPPRRDWRDPAGRERRAGLHVHFEQSRERALHAIDVVSLEEVRHVGQRTDSLHTPGRYAGRRRPVGMADVHSAPSSGGPAWRHASPNPTTS